MFAGLKEKALAAMEEDLRARVMEKIELFRGLKPSDVADDARYEQIVVKPLWLYVEIQAAGTLGVAQKLMGVDLEARFRKALVQVRDNLVQVDGETVVLDPEFAAKLGPTLVEALRAKA